MTDNQLENEVSITSTEWVSSREIEACQLCQGGFTTFHRKHHCRSCGHVVCGSCSSQRMTLGESSKKKRVCLSCAQVLEMLNQQMYPDLEASIHEPKSELKAILSIDTANEQALVSEYAIQGRNLLISEAWRNMVHYKSTMASEMARICGPALPREPWT